MNGANGSSAARGPESAPRRPRAEPSASRTAAPPHAIAAAVAGCAAPPPAASLRAGVVAGRAVRRAFCLSLALAAGLAAQGERGAGERGPERELALLVTATADRSVYLDRGRDAGLVVGTFVRLFPPGAGELEAEVRAVTATSARVDLPPGVPVPPVGTRGAARVAPPRAAPRAVAGRPAAPEHPPWTRQEEPRAPDQPLLVPTFGQRPDERPATLDGRVFGSLQHARESGAGTVHEYSLARLGARADAGNVLGEGERWRLAGELAARDATVAGEPDVEDRNARLDLASVAFGTEDYAPTGVELGRFLSPHLPELGLLDGVEVVRRYRGGVRLGGGFGAYPRPFPARDAGDDVGAHLFADWTADERRTAAAALGVQKTWHRGEADRDLLLARAEWRPAERLWLHGHTKLDLYTGSDRVKGRGLELTEVYTQARWEGDTLGTGLAASRFTWPELKRREYQDLPVDLVRDGFVDRIAWHGSWRVSTPVSLRVRADAWRDQDRDGDTFGADLDWRGLWNDRSALSLAAFVNDGGWTAGPGARATVRDRLGDATWRASYRWYRYELDGLVGGADETWTRQSAEVALSLPLGDGGDVELSAERWFGDREDATHFFVFVQWRL